MRVVLVGLMLCVVMDRPAIASGPSAVTALAYSPDGKHLAAGLAGFVYLISAGEVVDLARVPEAKTTALAFSPDGKRLTVATGSPGQRGVVRVFSVMGMKREWMAGASQPEQPSGKQEGHRDLIYGLAFSPDGKLIATGGYDRRIILWDAGTGKVVRELVDHSDAVYGVAWSPDGKRLASVAADRTVKVWDPVSGKRLYTLGESTDWLYALAWSPDGKHLAAAGVDKSIRIWQIQNDAGTLVQSAFAHEKAVMKLAYSGDGKTLFSLGEDRVVKAWETSKLAEKKVYQQLGDVVCLAVKTSGGAAVDEFAVGRLDGKLKIVDAGTGKVKAEPLPEKFPIVKLGEPSIRRVEAAEFKSGSVVVGNVGQPGQRAYLRFALKKDQEIGFQVKRPEGSKLDAVLEWFDEAGKLIAQSSSSVLGYRCASAGIFALAIRDKDYRGGEEFRFVLHAGSAPIVTSVFPLGVQAGKEAEVRVRGVNLGGEKVVKVLVSGTEKMERSALPWPEGETKPVNLPSLAVGQFAEANILDGRGEVDVPGTVNGVLDRTQHLVKFRGERGKPLVVEVLAARLGSSLDSNIEIQDSLGRPVQRAVLRSVAKTYVTLRDRDAADSGLRLENWSEFGLNDYVYAGTELLRLRAMPKGPDEDCRFWSIGGRRLGYLGTTPRAQPLGGTVYKVELQPAGMSLPPNGYPAFGIDYRNDDGGVGFGKDSMLWFEPPGDGEYLVCVRDVIGRMGEEYAYRLTIRRPEPDFTVDFQPRAPEVWQNGAVPITVTVKRKDGYQGPIQLKVEDLDGHLSATGAVIGEEEESGTIGLSAGVEEVREIKPFRVRATALIEGKEVVREVVSGAPKIVPPGDLVTTVETGSVSIVPGGEAKITARIERRNNFKGRVPVEVRGLPYGVQVLDVGLNGILITENETVRTFTLKAEAWVKAGEYPLVVLSKREGKSGDYGARPILLKVGK